MTTTFIFLKNYNSMTHNMTHNNRDDFDQCTALVFDLLYTNFPQEMDVAIDKLSESYEDNMLDNYFATMRFLQREGLLCYQELYYTVFKGVVLTAKGLKVLDTILDTSALKKNIAQQINQALESQNDKTIKMLIQEMMRVV